jgi:hypothetical protein
VVDAIALGDRLRELRQPLERRIAVHAIRGLDRGVQRVDRDRRRRQIRVAAPEVDQPRPGLRSRERCRSDDPREVLLREAGEELRKAMNVQDVRTLLIRPGRSSAPPGAAGPTRATGFPHSRTLASHLGAARSPDDHPRMPPAASYKTRMAVAEDAPNLRRLAALDSQPPLSGPVLMGEINGVPAAAISLGSGRVVADPFRHTAELVATMRIRAAGRVERRAPLRERIAGGLRVTRPATPRLA